MKRKTANENKFLISKLNDLRRAVYKLISKLPAAFAAGFCSSDLSLFAVPGLLLLPCGDPLRGVEKISARVYTIVK